MLLLKVESPRASESTHESRRRFRSVCISAEIAMSSVFQVSRDELPSPSPQKRPTGDGDSGYHEPIDDAAAFELPAPVARRSSSPLSAAAAQNLHEQHVGTKPGAGGGHYPYRTRSNEVVSADSAYGATTPEYSPVSPSPRVPVSDAAGESVRSNGTQPDGSPEGRADESGVSFSSPSPAASEEDVSEKESDDAFEEAGSSSPEEDELGEQWNPDFYTLQLQAPQPEAVHCSSEIESRPPHYGSEYHGVLSREEAADLLGFTDGRHLVRRGSDGDFILSFMLAGRMWNFRLFYEDSCHYLFEKKFDTLHELVQDSLITGYVNQHNVTQTLEKGIDLTRQHSRRFRRKPAGRVKGPKGKGKSAYLERLRGGSFESLPLAPLGRMPGRMMSTPAELESVPMTPNSNQQQSDLDLTTLSERRGNSTSTATLSNSTSVAKAMKERRAFSTESIQLQQQINRQRKSSGVLDGNRYKPVLALRDAVRADREVEVSILSEKAATLLGIAPPKQYKRASMYDPLIEQRVVPDTTPVPSMPPRSNSYHPGLKRGRAIDRGIPREMQRNNTKRPPSSSSSSPSPYYKAHKFKPLTYVHPTWCVICHHFLWGLKMQGLRCQDCGIDIHRQCCAVSLDHECNPTKKIVKRMFGVDLTTRVKAEEAAIPSLLLQCITHIENSGLEEQGMYRVSGLTSEILELKERFDSGEKIDFSRYTDISVVCGAVKLYLRELPIPVVSFDAYNEVMKATCGIEDLRADDVDWSPLVNALKLLPKAHYNVLKYLAEHLHRVDETSSLNKMSAYNLSVVFAPTLMRPPCDDLSLVKDIPLQRHFVEMVILKHKLLFT